MCIKLVSSFFRITPHEFWGIFLCINLILYVLKLAPSFCEFFVFIYFVHAACYIYLHVRVSLLDMYFSRVILYGVICTVHVTQ